MKINSSLDRHKPKLSTHKKLRSTPAWAMCRITHDWYSLVSTQLFYCQESGRSLKASLVMEYPFLFVCYE